MSAADAIAVMRELGDGSGTRIEEVQRGGIFAAAPGVDANGDGVVTLQDALAVAHRLFPGVELRWQRKRNSRVICRAP